MAEDNPKPRPSASIRRADGSRLSDEDAQRRADQEAADKQAADKKIKSGMTTETFKLAPPASEATPTPRQAPIQAKKKPAA